MRTIELTDDQASNLEQILEANVDADSIRSPLFWQENNMTQVENLQDTVSDQLDA